jgi:hypothetical protein
MSTRSVIAYEDDNGNCVGVYCHYDGYPRHMYPIIDSMTYDQVKDMVEDGLIRDGLRSVENDESYDTFEGKSDRTDWLRTSVHSCDNGVDYTYFKRKDGSIYVTACDGREVENPY